MTIANASLPFWSTPHYHDSHSDRTRTSRNCCSPQDSRTCAVFWQTPGSRGGEFRGYLQPTQRSPGIRQRVYRTHPKAPSVVLRPNSQSFESYPLFSSAIRNSLENIPYWTDGGAQEINRPFRGLFSFKMNKLFFSDNIGAHEAACLPTLLRKISMRWV
jgi:hypothetical protein